MTSSVLWVEDDANDAYLIGRAIQKAGLKPPNIVTDGLEAVAYLSGAGIYADRAVHPFPCLLLLDIKLPKMSGFEILQWIRQQPGLRRLPVIMFTSSKSTADIDRAYDLGANAYLLKPVDHVDLVEAVGRLRAFWVDLNVQPRISSKVPAPEPEQAGP